MTLWRKQEIQPDQIAISTSRGLDVLGSSSLRMVPSGMIIDNSAGNFVIRIPGSSSDSAVVEAVESWPRRFAELGLRVSTGPVVTFRATEFLLSKPNGGNSAPLLSVFNVTPFDTVWPLARRKHPTAFKVCPASQNLLLRSLNYVLLRRFSAKEERRRLTASCLMGDQLGYPWVAIENHLNYVYHGCRELTPDETFGLSALFNSALLDQYFRTLSGNTQVNATELRTMPMPDLETISRIGRAVAGLGERTSPGVEEIVLAELGIDGALRTHLMGVASE